MNELFRRFAQNTSDAVGSTWAFLLAIFIIVIWAISGPFFNFSNVWQLIINTGTTIITFLMIFLVQNAQNRESKATQLKLDELIRAQQRANDKLIGIETKSDEQLEREIKKEKQLEAIKKKKS